LIIDGEAGNKQIKLCEIKKPEQNPDSIFFKETAPVKIAVLAMHGTLRKQKFPRF